MAAEPTSANSFFPKNRLLSGLPPNAWERLRPQLEPVALALHQKLAKPGEPFEHVYFPDGSLASLVARLPDGVAVEVGLVGREGMVGLPVVLGATVAPPLDVFVQLAGGGWRMTAAALRTELKRTPALRERLLNYAQARLAQVSQTAACNARHHLNQRLARWLLMAREGVQQDELPLKHDFLSMMLGVRRAGVTVAAGILQQAGLIRYRPGAVTILDAPGLEAAACTCFGIVQAEYDRLLRAASPA